MSVLRGAAVGALTLTMLDVLVGTDQAAGRVGGLLTGVAGLAEAFMNPDKPAIRDRSGCLDNGPASHTKKSGGGIVDQLRKDAGGVFSINPLHNPVTAHLIP